ncbi:MAG: hypothetical protein ACPGVT_12595 [Maricaulaceae bacterium]
MKKLIGLLILIALLLGAGYFLYNASPSSARSVSEIAQNQSRYDAQEVTVRGHVGKVLSIGGTGTYTLSDDDATILVVYSSGVSPDKGERVTVKGTFQEAYNILGRRQGVIIESERK